MADSRIFYTNKNILFYKFIFNTSIESHTSFETNDNANHAIRKKMNSISSSPSRSGSETVPGTPQPGPVISYSLSSPMYFLLRKNMEPTDKSDAIIPTSSCAPIFSAMGEARAFKKQTANSATEIREGSTCRREKSFSKETASRASRVYNSSGGATSEVKKMASYKITAAPDGIFGIRPPTIAGGWIKTGRSKSNVLAVQKAVKIERARERKEKKVRRTI